MYHHSYPWHEGHTSLHQEGVHGHLSEKLHHRYTARYGDYQKGPTNLRVYPLAGYEEHINNLIKKYGYDLHDSSHGVYNYNTKHLWIPASSDIYNSSWRKLHELAHALTVEAVNSNYGDGRRLGRLGAQRTPREAHRTIEWEWMAVHKMRELVEELGIRVSGKAFARELNTIIHDTIYRLITGKYSDPQADGFVPVEHIVPIDVAFKCVDEAAKELGLQHHHELSKNSSCIAKNEPNLRDTSIGRKMSNKNNKADIATRQDIAQGLADALKKAIANVSELQEKEAEGEAKLNKSGPADGTAESHSTPSAGIQAVQMQKMGALPDAPGTADDGADMQDQMMAMSEDGSKCKCGDDGEALGELDGHTHYMCKGCGAAYSRRSAIKKDEFIDIEHEGDPDKREVHVGEDNSGLDEKSKEVSGDEGSGGQLKKFAGLPGMTPAVSGGTPPNKAAKPNMTNDTRESLAWLKDQGQKVKAGATAETQQSLDWLKDQGAKAKAATAPTQRIGSTGGKPVPFTRKPGADEALAAKANEPRVPQIGTQEQQLAADKKAAGVGFLHNLVTKFKGAGTKTWNNLAGAGTQSAGKAADRTARRMALNEDESMDKTSLAATGSGEIGGMHKEGMNMVPPVPASGEMVKDAETSVAQANQEMKGFKSLASNPTGMPKLPGMRAKTSASQANKEIQGFKSLASSPTAMPQMPGIKKGEEE